MTHDHTYMRTYIQLMISLIRSPAVLLYSEHLYTASGCRLKNNVTSLPEMVTLAVNGSEGHV